MENRRRFPRFESALEVKYSPLEREMNNFTVSKNISRGGICMPILSNLFKSDTLIKLEINTQDNWVTATGKIRWTKPIKRPALLGQEAGIEFIKISPESASYFSKSNSL